METHLPDFVLARLYKNLLVVPDNPTTPSQKSVPKGNKINLPNATNHDEALPLPKNWWLGDNLGKIAIVVEDPANVYIGEKELEFLTNILAACKLSLAHVAIINYAKTPVGYTEIAEATGSKKILLFGVNTAQLQLQFSFPFYQPQLYDNCNFALAASLHKMMQNSPEAKEEKKKLWVCLQQFFKI